MIAQLAYYLPGLMFLALTVFLLTGFPVALTLGGTSIIFGLLGAAVGIFSYVEFFNILPRIWGGLAENLVLVAAPMFVLMGSILERSGIAEDLLDSATHLTRKLPGGTAIAVILIGMVLGATTGVIAATVVMLTVFAVPAMLKQRYQKEFAAGTVAAAGTLGILIPPSIMLIFMGDILQVSVGKLFLGAIVPGLMLTVIYCLFAFGVAYFRPDIAPRPELASADVVDQKALSSAVKGFIAPIILIGAVLGSIFAGWATPTEAAAVGAAGAFLLALVRGRMDLSIFSQAIRDAGIMTTIVFSILIGATAFSYVFRSLGGEWLVSDFVNFMGLGPWGLLYIIMVIVFLFGFFFDWLEITLIVLPIFSPLIAYSDFGIDYFQRTDVLLWFAILVAVNLQTSFLSPPFGYTLFYMKGAVKSEIRITTIYKGVIPYIILQLIVLFSIMAFPFLVTWLPNSILG